MSSQQDCSDKNMDDLESKINKLELAIKALGTGFDFLRAVVK